MNLESIKEMIKPQLGYEEIACGEILFNNCECQILSQSAVSVDFLVNTANEKESENRAHRSIGAKEQ